MAIQYTGPTDLMGEPIPYGGGALRLRASPPGAPPVQVRLPNGTFYDVRIDEDFARYTAAALDGLRSRGRWRNIKSAREKIAVDCRDYLAALGLRPDEEIKQIAGAGVVEVAIPEPSGDAAFAFPWEFALAESTKPVRRSQPLLVVRHLVRNAAVAGGAPPSSAVVVQSAPGTLAGLFSFDSEYKLVQSSLFGLTVTPLERPTAASLAAYVQARSPGVIHFAGVDGLQAARLLKWPAEKVVPGMVLADAQGMPEVVAPEALAAAATGGAAMPQLVSYNIYNSSWPAAAETVRLGAAASIGFQDEIDDTLAELFFARFYEAWQNSGWNVLAAYQDAWRGLSAEAAKLRGTGIVLWSGASLIGAAPPAVSSPRPETLQSPANFADPHEALEVVVDPCPKLNYSMLHNGASLFHKFEIKRQVPGRLLGVCVEVVLHAGSETAAYRATFDLNRGQPIVNVNDFARVSLTSDMARSLRESVMTSLFVHVTWGERTVFQNTFRVAMLPPDEWRDDDLNRVWLPSFVLPRDPVIAQVVDCAQKYLCALADDAGAGFDGYQSTGDEGTLEERSEGVDRQVQALWWGLVLEHSLGYINPPPSFTAMSQRLRTPSDIIHGRRGTCIDLALLLAALLEYVDIYPVVFLLEAHAFPGYCRSEDSYEELRRVFLAAPSDSGAGDETPTQLAWVRDRRYYSAIVQLVRDGHLVPLESVWLTNRSAFTEGVEQGTENLRNKAEFQFLIDIKLAREAGVTPLPLWSLGK